MIQSKSFLYEGIIDKIVWIPIMLIMLTSFHETESTFHHNLANQFEVPAEHNNLRLYPNSSTQLVYLSSETYMYIHYYLPFI